MALTYENLIASWITHFLETMSEAPETCAEIFYHPGSEMRLTDVGGEVHEARGIADIRRVYEAYETRFKHSRMYGLQLAVFREAGRWCLSVEGMHLQLSGHLWAAKRVFVLAFVPTVEDGGCVILVSKDTGEFRDRGMHPALPAGGLAPPNYGGHAFGPRFPLGPTSIRSTSVGQQNTNGSSNMSSPLEPLSSDGSNGSGGSGGSGGNNAPSPEQQQQPQQPQQQPEQQQAQQQPQQPQQPAPQEGGHDGQVVADPHQQPAGDPVQQVADMATPAAPVPEVPEAPADNNDEEVHDEDEDETDEDGEFEGEENGAADGDGGEGQDATNGADEAAGANQVGVVVGRPPVVVQPRAGGAVVATAPLVTLNNTGPTLQESVSMARARHPRPQHQAQPAQNGAGSGHQGGGGGAGGHPHGHGHGRERPQQVFRNGAGIGAAPMVLQGSIEPSQWLFCSDTPDDIDTLSEKDCDKLLKRLNEAIKYHIPNGKVLEIERPAASRMANPNPHFSPPTFVFIKMDSITTAEAFLRLEARSKGQTPYHQRGAEGKPTGPSSPYAAGRTEEECGGPGAGLAADDRSNNPIVPSSTA
ncbi:unnamed protein product [Vitrella brassicaformis CCMP3155]|uniref:NTF2 domain-containing protein n=2 Tax=Vitrella brassicaformis TaxID=1169539 RepID=A0A0G4EF40_VITBC|nr:unnamed protein product [Vitrella brassicaformis CCMP3155]|eukprot:CEL94576.1 unnamed protein product [Vitrella brassicaformis CCMP3155]